MVGLLLLTHGKIGRTILDEASCLLRDCPLKTGVLNVQSDADPDELVSLGYKLCRQLDVGDGVLVLTDMFGATPYNVAVRLKKNYDHEKMIVLSGLNMPMLIRLMNYPALNVEQLAEKAKTGGRDGIVICHQEQGV